MEENFKEQNMDNTSRDLTLRPVVPRAEEAERARSRCRRTRESVALMPLFPEKRPVPPLHRPAELQAEPPRPEQWGPAWREVRDTKSLQMLGKSMH